jgi:GSH-dependent disulfide-bond oxidoreductase
MSNKPKMKLYFHDSPSPLRALLGFEEMGIPYELVPIDLYRGESHKPDFLKINPNGKVPALQDGEIVVFDSTAILLYIAEKSGKFLPSNAVERAQAMSWLLWAASGLGPFSGQSVHFLSFAEEKVPYAINRYTREAERHYEVLESRLSQAPYLAGSEYSLADMSAWSWVKLAALVLFGKTLVDFPAIKDWFDRVSARPAIARTLKIAADIRSKSKTQLDEEARRYMFPQNVAAKSARANQGGSPA